MSFLSYWYAMGQRLCCPAPQRRPGVEVIIVVIILVYANVLVLAGVDTATVALLVSFASGAASSAVAGVRSLRRRTNYSASVLSRAAAGKGCPRWQVVEALGRQLGGDQGRLETLWQRAQDQKESHRSKPDDLGPLGSPPCR